MSLARPIPPLNLTAKDTLRLTFTIFTKNEAGAAENVVPHQTFLRFFDPATNEEGIQPIRVKAGGKAKFDLVRLVYTCYITAEPFAPRRTCLNRLRRFRLRPPAARCK